MALSISTAASINGVITPARGESSRNLIALLGVPPEVLEWQLEVRRRHDAVLVGTRTVMVDDPSLTSHGRLAVRVTVDPAGRIPRSARFFDGSARTLVGVSETTPREYLDFLAERGVEAVLAGQDRVDPRLLLDSLAEKGLASVVAEGGGTLNRALLEAGLVDRLHLVLIPIVLDAGSVNLFEGPGFARLHLESCERAGDYLLMTYGCSVSPTDAPPRQAAGCPGRP